jgi:hypothetical protein
MEMTTPLLSIQQALLLKDEQEIFAQVDMRRKLISEMVGALYPSILEGEIEKLFNRIHWLRHPVGDFQI